ncbi:spheroidene monooxygenase [Pararhodonellum marinum]|uniref:spheroidene monooxygenase n=1 Tax=Pararhodonellum marinum TaxID=2755358 RepID=UPI00188EAD40|nr:spheroidene monooxygenase [Pararhodonellum marinum]
MDQPKSITSITFFEFPTKKRWWAFNQMQQALDLLNNLEGTALVKLLGSGSGTGFSLKPDFSTYALLTVWENRDHAKNYEASEAFLHFSEKSSSYKTFWLACVQSHGTWGGQNPFNGTAQYLGGPIMVLTRARIRMIKLLRFWKHVPQASQSIAEAKGLIYTKGIGQWPAIEQATFSHWESEEAMKTYAYSSVHKAIIQKVKKEKWYKEELFARFIPIQSP